MQLYNKRNNAKLDKEVIKQAQKATKKTTNCTLKYFFKTVKKSKALSKSTNSIIYQIYIIYIYMKLINAYIKLAKKAIFISKATKEEKAKKKALKTKLKLKGYPTAKRKGLKSIIIQYICYKLVMERNILNYRTQCGKSIKCLIN